MSTYRPYPKTKPSGVEWLGNLPEGWVLRPLKFFATFRGGATPSKDNVEFWNGDIPWVSPKDMKRARISDSIDHISEGAVLQSSTSRIAPNNLLMVVRSGILQHTIPVAINDVPVTLNQDMRAVTPSRQCTPDFLYYWFVGNNTPLLLELGKQGATVESIEQEYLSNTRISLPALPEQHQIASFLDRECGKLDALQAKQERLIELLKEKRQALISHAVTKGLNPNAKLKPSGIEWLGDVPDGWAVTRVKFHVSRFEQGWSPQCEGRNKEDGEFGVLKVGCVNGGNFRVEEHKALPSELEPRLQYALKRGDLLVSRANTRELVGSAAVVNHDHDDILLCDKLYRLRFHRGVSEIYISHFLGTSEVRQQIELDATGASASMVNIGQDCIRELNIALPPLAEQRAIVAHLDEKCGKIDQLKAKAERGIELLKERRSALISAAVTGKIDVRDA